MGRLMQFSANLGFLWTELALPDAIRAAKAAGFDAVECHWPYDADSAQVKAALVETEMTMLGLNTARGDVSAGDNGLSALPDRTPEARAAIEQAVAYATDIGARNIHVMAGFSAGTEAHETFVANLTYACALAAPEGITILIEPLNRYDAPGYFLQTTKQATAIIAEVDAPNLKIMFDCYHVQLMEGDLTNKLTQLQEHIGHIQVASVPDRGAPDHGEINFDYVFRAIKELGFSTSIGAEYKPDGATSRSLNWFKQARKI
jgi:hydroxypyruvate isomerase